MTLNKRLFMYYLLSILFLLTSCSWTSHEFQDAIKTKKIDTVRAEDDFDLDSDLAKKFETKDKSGKSLKQPKQNNKKPISLKSQKTINDKNRTKKISTVALNSSKVSMPLKQGKEEKKSDLKAEADKIRELIKSNSNADKKSMLAFNNFNNVSKVGEEIYIDVDFLGITLGKVYMTRKTDKLIGDKASINFYGRAKSSPFYKYMYELDDHVESFVNKESFIPLKFSMIQEESKKNAKLLQLFDHEKNKCYFKYRKDKKGEITEKEGELLTPKYFLDALASLYFLRGLKFERNAIYQIPIINKGKLSFAIVKVVEFTDISTELGDNIPAVKLHIVIKQRGKDEVKADIDYWISNDARRIGLLFEADLKFGSISGETVKFKPGR